MPVAAIGGEDGAGDDEDRTWGPIGALSGLAERLGGAVSETIGIDTEEVLLEFPTYGVPRVTAELTRRLVGFVRLLRANGFALIRELRRMPEWRDVPVVALSANELSPEERSARLERVMGVGRHGQNGRDGVERTVGRIQGLRCRRSPLPLPGSEHALERLTV